MNRIIPLVCLLAAFNIHAALDTVVLKISQTALDTLESHPFTNDDVYGTFIGGDSTYDSSKIHFRGAYTLRDQINSSSPQRNYKLKTPSGTRYRGYREWNFNFERPINQKFAYDIFAAAGVPAAVGRHIIFRQYTDTTLNYSSVYFEYFDPDNKDWLATAFGSNDGDLYKAGNDLPDSIKRMADLIILGDVDSCYYLHYQKKTNNDTAGGLDKDYRTIREFIYDLNTVPDEQFESWLNAHFEVPNLLKYLVIANFIAFWDGYPNRSKNYWLYLNPLNNKWNFIPWDVNDALTQTSANTYMNNIGTTGYIGFMFNNPAWYYAGTVYNHAYNHYDSTMYDPPFEVHDRPLLRRTLQNQNLRAAYIAEYRNALETYLKNSTLDHVLDSLGTLGVPSTTYNNSIISIKNFLDLRTANVTQQLAAEFPIGVLYRPAAKNTTTHPFRIYRAGGRLVYTNLSAKVMSLSFFTLDGRRLISKQLKAFKSGTFPLSYGGGLLLYRASMDDGTVVQGLLPADAR